MNRRRILNSIHRDIARKQGVNAVAWFNGQSFHQSATDVPFERLSNADLNKVGPRLVAAPPVERAVCAYCTAGQATDANFPYCSPGCAVRAEQS